MITIRAAQMEAFKQAREKDFKDRLTAHLLELGLIEPGRVADEVEAGIESSKNFGLEREADIAAYIVAACRYLGGFCTLLPEAALHILRSLGAPAEQRVSRFEEWSASHKRIG